MRPAGHIENGVMFGNDGYLFLLDGGHHVFDLLLGLRKVAEQPMPISRITSAVGP